MAEGGAQGAEELKRRAAEHFAAGRILEARVAYSEALRNAPKDLEAREGLVRCVVAVGNAALERGDADRAIAHFQMALELSPFHPEADAGLRRAGAASRAKASPDPVGQVLESLPPVKAYREMQVADRMVAKVTGAPAPSQILKDSLDARREGLAKQGAPPRERRIEHELASAWRRRWLFRSLPGVAFGAGAAVALALGAPALLMWGVLLAIFAALWDIVFVERGAAHAPPPP